MDRYRKALIALLGVAVQLLTLAVHALDAGLLPAGWVPWVQAVVAVATAAGVYQVPNARQILAVRVTAAAGTEEVVRRAARRAGLQPPDSGRARMGLLVAVTVLGLLAAAAGPALASSRSHVRIVAPRVLAAGVCDAGTLVVAWDAIQLAGRDWLPLADGGTLLVRDDGTTIRVDDGQPVVLQGHESSGRSGPTGQWVTLTGVRSGGDDRLRWPGWAESLAHGGHWDLVRVQVAGYRSTGYPIADGCTA